MPKRIEEKGKATLTIYTKEEVWAEIDRLYKTYPQLQEIVLSEDDCSGCVENDIGSEYGWKVALAWEELQSWYYLLDVDRNGKEKK